MEAPQPVEEVPVVEQPQEIYEVPVEETPQEIIETIPETEEIQEMTELLPEGEEPAAAEAQPLVEETDAAAEESESEKESEAAEEITPAEEDVTAEETEAMEIVEKEVAEVEVQYDGTMVDPGWIGNVSLETSDADNAQGSWNQENVDNVINVREDQMLRFKVTLELDGGLLTAENRTLVYQLPWQIRTVDASAGEVIDYEGGLIAQYLISEGGLVTLTFSDDYAQKNAAGDPLAAAVEFTTCVANLAWDQAG